MKIIVCAKQVVDASEMKIDPNTKKPILAGLERKVNDIDKNAVEEAIKIKEKHGGSITVITVGESDARERLKELLAMGADEAILIPADGDYNVITELLAAAIKKIGEYDIILCGEASTDMFSGQVGPRLAGLLGIPQITYAHTLTVEKDKVIGERNLGDKSVTIESTMPVVVTVTKEINEPRLPSLMQILGSANKPIHEWSGESLGVTPKSMVETISLEGVSMKRKNIVFEDASDENIEKLVDNLLKEGVVG
ncbi:MAG: electron transfer flavoprotein subunit beta [Thermoplasmata archaeon]|nr:MAG: electron transfer flavoprotein subunit beta [Thermoplasmata archaeon]HEC89188.1 electron transfer flavoprotein beta subunit/FixA family protein [Thermoplasmatales archaeon]